MQVRLTIDDTVIFNGQNVGVTCGGGYHYNQITMRDVRFKKSVVVEVTVNTYGGDINGYAIYKLE